MKLTSMLLLLITLVLGSATPGETKWWIFGQANEEVSFSYLYLNRVSYEESGPKTSVPKNTLEDGHLRINGRAKVGKGKIGGVRVSLDDRATWQEAKVADDGTFEFRFRPELGKTYVLFLEVTDTAGKINDVEKTRKELTVIESNAQQLVRMALDELVSAYRSEDPARFMKLVSGEFTGDSTNLDRAIRKDFSAFDNIDLRYTLNNVTLDPRGRAFAAITFSRSVTSSRSGKTISDKGVTEFIFKLEGEGAKVFSMKNPLIFGLSDPSEVATGSSTSISDPLIILDRSGNVAKVLPSLYVQLIADGSFRITTNADGTTTITSSDGSYTTRSDGTLVSSSGGSSTVESGNNIAVVSYSHPPQGFDFTLGAPDNGAGASFFITGGGVNYAYGFLGGGHSFKDLGAVSIRSVSEAPATGYTIGTSGQNFYQGNTYAFLLANGKYAIMEVKSVSIVYAAQMIITMRIDYKYQPAGGRQF